MAMPLRAHGLVLAAGAGTRFGRPKALVRDEAGVPWIQRAVDALGAGGCSAVTVVLGAEAADAAALVPEGAGVVVAADWELGMSRSLRAGVAAVGAAGADPAEVIVIVPVDTPGLPAEAIARVRAAASVDGSRALARATYAGAPGHPVVIGAAHLPALVAEIEGDIGAGPYLARNGARAVPCDDLWSGADHDHAP